MRSPGDVLQRAIQTPSLFPPSPEGFAFAFGVEVAFGVACVLKLLAS